MIVLAKGQMDMLINVRGHPYDFFSPLHSFIAYTLAH